MMNDCFDNIVSLREYCDATTPFSGIYLNDLGLGKKQIEDIITGEFATVRDLVNATIRQAAREVAATIYAQFASTIQVRSLIESGHVGIPASEGPTLVASTGDLVGIKIDLENAANFMAYDFRTVSLYVDFSGAVDLLIYDLHTDTLLDTVAITAVAGERVEIMLNKQYLSTKRPRSLWIGYDSTGIDSYKTTTRDGQCCGVYNRHTSYTNITGWNKTTSSAMQTTSGLGLLYSLNCDSHSWLCAYAQVMALPIAHMAAAELYRRGLMVAPTVRSNNSTNTNADLMKANMVWHLEKHSEMMNAALKSVHLPTSSVCYSCKSPVRHAISLP